MQFKISYYKHKAIAVIALLSFSFKVCLNDPVNWVDPDGLWSLTVAWHGWGGIPFLVGAGGTITFGSQNGTSFFNATVGVGSGVFYDSTGGPPSRSDLSDSPCDSNSGYIGFGLDASIGAGLGPVGVMTGANWAAGIGGMSENGDVTGIGPNGEAGYSEWNLLRQILVLATVLEQAVH